MRTQGLLQRSAGAARCGPDRGHGPTVADHDERLSLALDAVEHVGELPRRIGCTELPHRIRLSDRSNVPRGSARDRPAKAQRPASFAPILIAALGLLTLALAFAPIASAASPWASG